MTSTTECSVLFRPETDALRFLPEGPYTLDDQRMTWVGIQHGADSTVGSLNVLNLLTGQNESMELPGRPGFAFPTTQQDVFVCGAERSLGLFDCRDGRWTELAGNIDHAVDNTIINDAVAYKDNLIFGCKELEFTTKKAGLYLWRGRDEQLVLLRDDQICSNGKAVLESDGRLWLIDIDTPSKCVTKAQLDLAAGTLGNQEVIVDLTHEDRFPDGMILTPDHESLIIAFYDPGDPAAGEAIQYSLADASVQHIWTCPGSPRVTCPQLVRRENSVQLVLTTAVEHMEADQQARHPNAGSLFIGDTTFDGIGDQPKFILS